MTLFYIPSKPENFFSFCIVVAKVPWFFVWVFRNFYLRCMVLFLHGGICILLHKRFYSGQRIRIYHRYCIISIRIRLSTIREYKLEIYSFSPFQFIQRTLRKIFPENREQEKLWQKNRNENQENENWNVLITFKIKKKLHPSFYCLRKCWIRKCYSNYKAKKSNFFTRSNQSHWFISLVF